MNVKVFPSDIKYEAILLLAKLGMKPKDITALSVNDIRVIEGYVVLSVNNKNFRIPLYDAGYITDYLAKYSNAIMEASGLVFHGTQGKPMTTTNLKAYIRVYINKMHKEITFADIGWDRGTIMGKTLNTPDSLNELLDKMKGHLS